MSILMFDDQVAGICGLLISNSFTGLVYFSVSKFYISKRVSKPRVLLPTWLLEDLAHAKGN